MSLPRHTAYNLVGVFVPIVLALVTVPAYLKVIGPERYGVMTLSWLILGYFGVFDLGLGRALAQRIATLRDSTPESRATVFGTAVVANAMIGLIGAVILWQVARYSLSSDIKMSSVVRAESRNIAPMLALALPVATTMGMLSGSLIARERFAELTVINSISNALFQIIPLAGTYIFGPNIWALVCLSIGSRCIGLGLLWWRCAREYGADAYRRFDKLQLKSLLHFGGWVTVTGLISPLLVMTDRFLVGRTLGPVAVTAFTVPTQITSRLSPIAGAFGGAVFPKLAYANPDEADRLSKGSVQALFAVMTAPVAAGLAVMAPALHLWLGSPIGEQAAPIGRILLVAAWINVFGQVPYWRMQARGRPKTVALMHVSELLLYIPCLFFMLDRFGLIGAALTGLGRMAVDAIALQWLAERRWHNVAGFLTALTMFAAEEWFIRVVDPRTAGSIGLGAGCGLAAAILGFMALDGDARGAIFHFARNTMQPILNNRRPIS